MIPTHVLARRPLIGMVAGLLLVSACGTAAESTPTPITPASTMPAPTMPASTMPASTMPAPTMPTGDIVVDGAPDTTQVAPASTGRDETVAPTTTLPPVTSPPATVPPADPAPLDAVDVSGRTVFGVSVFDAVGVDAVADDVSARLGSPTTDSGWQPTIGQSCAGSTDFRVLWWGDFRMTFERYQGDGAVRDELSAWTVGDPTLFELTPIGDVPATSPSGIVTLEGIGLGSTRADVGAAWANINDGGDGVVVVIDRGGSLAIGLDDDEQVVGFGDGPFDCPVDELR